MYGPFVNGGCWNCGGLTLRLTDMGSLFVALWFDCFNLMVCVAVFVVCFSVSRLMFVFTIWLIVCWFIGVELFGFAFLVDCANVSFCVFVCRVCVDSWWFVLLCYSCLIDQVVGLLVLVLLDCWLALAWLWMCW